MIFLSPRRVVCFALALMSSAAQAEKRYSTVECNEKIRLLIIKSASDRCNQNYEDLFWSEKELDVSDDGKIMAGGFSFKCKNGKRYLGLVESTFPPQCEILDSEISHTSQVPQETLLN